MTDQAYCACGCNRPVTPGSTFISGHNLREVVARRKKNLTTCTCKQCGREFEEWPCNVARGKGKFCSQACSGKWRSSRSRGSDNPAWKGNDAKTHSGRARIQKAMPVLGGCQHEGCEKQASDRHHVDGNTKNNDPSNIRQLCRSHHMEEDGRLEALHEAHARWLKERAA